jgi:two-component system NtrC family sensor kinase
VIRKINKKRKELKLDYIMEDMKVMLKESLDGSERVKGIVHELNCFSRMDEEEYKDADINECIESAITIVWNELKYKSTLEKNYGKLPLTKCYTRQINQIFVNLLINAVNSIAQQGIITIKTWHKDSWVWMEVSDTGCGIPRENLAKIFEPFFTTKDVGKGTGLGLSITYEIVRRHKGEITVKSEVGKGTSFTVRIPIV